MMAREMITGDGIRMDIGTIHRKVWGRITVMR